MSDTYADLSAEFDTYGALKQASGSETIVEEVPLGVFVMTEVSVSDGSSGAVMQIEGIDRSIRIARASWIDPYPIAASANLGETIALVLSDRWSDVETDFTETAQVLPASVLGLQEGGGSGRDPWADAQRLASAGGFDLYFDGDGVAVLVPVPDPTEQSPVEVYAEDEEAMVLDVSRRLSTEQTFNGVVVTGEGSNVRPPVRAVVFDEDPSSPTYRFGLFGERPMFMSSPLVTSADEATVVAGAELAKIRGAEENVEWSQITDPSLDAGDVVQISNTGVRMDKVLVIDKLSIPLSVQGSMRATARTVRVVQGA
jgi:hypothetical protein